MKHIDRSSLPAIALLVLLTIGVTLIAGARASATTQEQIEPGTDFAPSTTDLEALLALSPTLVSGEPVNLTFTLTNISPDRLFVLAWYTPLEGLAGEIFRVERDGRTVPYTGILAYRGDPSQSSYIELDPGESATALQFQYRPATLPGQGR